MSKYLLSASLLLSTLSSSQLTYATGSFEGKYEICRYNENSSGGIKIRQNDDSHVIIEEFKLLGNHYLNRVKRELFSESEGLSKTYAEGSRLLSEFILYNMPNNQFNLKLIPKKNLEENQYGLATKHNNEDIYIYFNVNKEDKWTYTLLVEYPYSDLSLGLPRPDAAPSERFNLIKVGSKLFKEE